MTAGNKRPIEQRRRHKREWRERWLNHVNVSAQRGTRPKVPLSVYVERDRNYETDTRTAAQIMMGDPSPMRSALKINL